MDTDTDTDTDIDADIDIGIDIDNKYRISKLEIADFLYNSRLYINYWFWVISKFYFMVLCAGNEMVLNSISEKNINK